MEYVIDTIIQVDLNDDTSFDMSNVTKIMESSKHVGYQISLIGKLENIKVPFHIDLATGDPITPSRITYKYRQLIDRSIFEIKSYTVETILAEKLQTIMDKRIGNSRMKDFYDIYILMKLHTNLFDIGVLNTAIRTTFEYRVTPIDKMEFKDVLNILEEDNSFISRWTNFTKKNYYVDNVEFKDVKLEILKLIDFIE